MAIGLWGLHEFLQHCRGLELAQVNQRQGQLGLVAAAVETARFEHCINLYWGWGHLPVFLSLLCCDLL